MNAREKLDEFAEINGMNKNQLIGWSIAADFAEWYTEQVKDYSIPDVVERSEQLVCDKCKIPYTKEEVQVGHCFNCGERD